MQYLRTTKVIKTGTSLCVVIPKEILKAINLERGDQVSFGFLDANTIAIHRITRQEIIELNQASAGATAK